MVFGTVCTWTTSDYKHCMFNIKGMNINAALSGIPSTRNEVCNARLIPLPTHAPSVLCNFDHHHGHMYFPSTSPDHSSAGHRTPTSHSRTFIPSHSSTCFHIIYRDFNLRPILLNNLFLIPQLLQLYPRHHPHERNHARRDDRPELHVQHVHVESSLRRRANRRQRQYQDHVSTHPVIFPHRLCLIHAPVEFRRIVLRDAYDRLDDE